MARGASRASAEAADLKKFAFISGVSPSGAGIRSNSEHFSVLKKVLVGLGCSFWHWWMHTPEAKCHEVVKTPLAKSAQARRRAGGGGALGADGQGCLDPRAVTGHICWYLK